MAQLLRAYVAHVQYGEYVEAEPNYRLARISLGLEKGGASMGGQEPADSGVVDKSITADGDQRAKAPFPNSNPGNAYALFEAGGSGTMVGWRVYTAGHVLYNNDTLQGPTAGTVRTVLPRAPAPRRVSHAGASAV
ncbi:MAG TPA: hypothetical protein VJN18_21020 [Polyangiaceae bacterium]|nr:hypothetical protein [Polyangiaceae bacterium]